MVSDAKAIRKAADCLMISFKDTVSETERKQSAIDGDQCILAASGKRYTQTPKSQQSINRSADWLTNLLEDYPVSKNGVSPMYSYVKHDVEIRLAL